MQYPVQVHATRFVNSPESAGIQLADVLAGAIAACLHIVRKGENPDGDYERQLYELIGPWECVEHIWPERKYTPSELGTDGPVHAHPDAFVDAILDGAAKPAGGL